MYIRKGNNYYLRGGAGALEANKAHYNVKVNISHPGDFELKVFLGIYIYIYIYYINI